MFLPVAMAAMTRPPMRRPAMAALARPSLRRMVAGARSSISSSAAGGDDRPDRSSATLGALVACGRRGRWRAALELLDELERDHPGGAPIAAYHSALLACRKHTRSREALALLERMGDAADAAAYNEVLHLLRLQGDFAAAERLWQRMPPTGPLHRGPLGYYHMLHLCAESGRWSVALELLDEMSGRRVEAHSGHYLAAVRACAKDRRWSEAVEIVRRAPPDAIASNAWLARAAIGASAQVRTP